MEVYREFTFEAAHRLVNLPSDHKCARLHGHSYRVRISCVGDVHSQSGMVIDFAEIKAKMSPLIEQLDHHYLNEVEGLANPTSEHLARWIWTRLKPELPQLSRVAVSETCTTGCTYAGE